VVFTFYQCLCSRLRLTFRFGIVARRWLPLVLCLFRVFLVAGCESGRVPGVLVLSCRCPVVTRVFTAGVRAGGMIGAAG